jgi:hypothetical protein
MGLSAGTRLGLCPVRGPLGTVGEVDLAAQHTGLLLLSRNHVGGSLDCRPPLPRVA